MKDVDDDQEAELAAREAREQVLDPDVSVEHLVRKSG